MKTHALKTWSNYFADLCNGLKNFEVRINDRDFQTGQILTCLARKGKEE